MPKPTATDSMTMAVSRCMMLLADCEEVQAFLGVANAADAYPKIYDTDIDFPNDGKFTFDADNLAAMRPLIIVEMAQNQGFRRRRAATSGTYNDSGKLQVMFIRNLDSGNGESLDASKVATVNMRAEIGAIEDEMWEKHETAVDADHDHLALNDTAVIGPYVSTHKEAKEDGAFVVAWVDISWGQN